MLVVCPSRPGVRVQRPGWSWHHVHRGTPAVPQPATTRRGRKRAPQVTVPLQSHRAQQLPDRTAIAACFHAAPSAPHCVWLAEGVQQPDHPSSWLPLRSLGSRYSTVCAVLQSPLLPWTVSPHAPVPATQAPRGTKSSTPAWRPPVVGQQSPMSVHNPLGRG